MATLKYSRQREAIKKFLMARHDHPTADVIYENMKNIYPNISLGTVYRNLSLLSDIGEIQKLPGFNGADHFDGRCDPHCHFLCTRCGSVTDMDNGELIRLLEKAAESFDGRITGYNAGFTGICRECLDKERAEAGAGQEKNANPA